MAYSLLYPWVVIALGLLGGLALGAYYLFAAAEYDHRIFCSKCGTMMYPCGLHCPKCGTPNPKPRALNWIGYSRLRTVIPSTGWKRHEEVLRSYRRCFYCGQPLHEPTLNQRCPALRKGGAPGEQSVDQYDAYVGRRRLDLCGRGRAGHHSHPGAAAGFLPVQEDAHQPVFPCT